MASSGVLNGTKMAVYISGTKIAHLTATGFSRSKETRETTDKDTTGDKTFKYKRGSSQLSGSAWFDFAAGYGFADLFTAMDNETELTALLATEESGDDTYQATVLLTQLDADFPDDDNSSYSFTMLVSGDWTTSTVT